MDIAGIPLRDVLLGATGAVGVYVAVTLLRLAQLKRRQTVEPEVEFIPPGFDSSPEDIEAEPEDSLEEDEEEVELYAPPTAAQAPSLGRRWPSWAKKTPAEPLPEPAPEPESEPDGASFGAELARSHLERELRQLKDEVTVLRNEIVALKAARSVSPQYEDAMALAQRGLTAQDMADRCGISLAEAELVWALARGAQQFDEEDDHGRETRLHNARSA